MNRRGVSLGLPPREDAGSCDARATADGTLAR